jgi:hypothetical protein
MRHVPGYPMSRAGLYLVRCSCGRDTSRKYAREHGGMCKGCVTGAEPESDSTPTREQRILDHGYQAYAREEGHYDNGNE